MSGLEQCQVVAAGCANLRQGDVIHIPHLPSLIQGELAAHVQHHVVLVSQTCDIVQPSKRRCVVAPVIQVGTADVEDARKGRKPLFLYLGPADSSMPPQVADMEWATSIPKESLEGCVIVARHTSHSSGPDVAALAGRIGRVFTRFPFPDEVYPVFRKLRSRAQSKTGSTGSPLGSVLDMILDLRVSSDQWEDSHRRMKLWVVVPGNLIASVEDYDPEWTADRVAGRKAGEALEGVSLTRVSELILENRSEDLTSLANLWSYFGQRLLRELLSGVPCNAVASLEVEVLSDVEMTYAQYRRTESLDLEALSGEFLV